MPDQKRYFADGVFVSEELPEIAIRLPHDFIYVGQTDFVLEHSVQVDRHHFVVAGPEGEVRRLIILHFESLLPAIESKINYRIPDPPDHAGPNYRYSLTPVLLGEHEYIHNTWFFDASPEVQEYPDKELAKTTQLLTQHGYALPSELQMSRYVRIVGAEQRSELILFYMEPLETTGFSVGDFVEGGRGAVAFNRLSAELTYRSESVFQIERG